MRNRVGLAMAALMVLGAVGWAFAPRGEAQRRRRGRTGPTSFFAAAAEAQPIRGDTKVEFDAVFSGALGWDREADRFVAPSAGAYHFDLGARISHHPPALSCAYTFSLVQKRGGDTFASYEMIVLEQSTVDVSDSARQDPVMRQTAWRLRDAAGITLALSEGDTIEVQASPSHDLCGGQARIAPKEGDSVVTFLSGHVVR